MMRCYRKCLELLNIVRKRRKVSGLVLVKKSILPHPLQLLDGIQRLDEPVSKITLKGCAGVPMVIAA